MKLQAFPVSRGAKICIRELSLPDVTCLDELPACAYKIICIQCGLSSDIQQEESCCALFSLSGHHLRSCMLQLASTWTGSNMTVLQIHTAALVVDSLQAVTVKGEEEGRE